VAPPAPPPPADDDTDTEDDLSDDDLPEHVEGEVDGEAIENDAATAARLQRVFDAKDSEQLQRAFDARGAELLQLDIYLRGPWDLDDADKRLCYAIQQSRADVIAALLKGVKSERRIVTRFEPTPMTAQGRRKANRRSQQRQWRGTRENGIATQPQRDALIPLITATPIKVTDTVAARQQEAAAKRWAALDQAKTNKLTANARKEASRGKLKNAQARKRMCAALQRKASRVSDSWS